jgi:hypothetical protein
MALKFEIKYAGQAKNEVIPADTSTTTKQRS